MRIAILAVALLSALFPISTYAQDQYDFTPPAGWTPDAVTSGMWLSPRAHTTMENIAITIVPLEHNGAGQTPTLDRATLKKMAGAATVWVLRQEKVCGGAVDGWYEEAT